MVLDLDLGKKEQSYEEWIESIFGIKIWGCLHIVGNAMQRNELE